MKRKRPKSQPSSDEAESIDANSDHSDEEYDERETKLLKKFQKPRQQQDSEEELFNVRSSSSSDDDSDDNAHENKDSDLDEDNYLPDEKAWGSKRRDYYYTDQFDEEYLGKKVKDIDAGLDEEEEAKRLQEQLLEQFDDEDFTLDLVTKDREETESKREEVIQRDLSKLSKREKLQLFTKESPEFFGIVEDFKAKISDLKDTIQPLAKQVERLKNSNDKIVQFAKNFCATKSSVVNSYLTYIACYLLLKANNVNIKNHPCLKYLLFYKDLLSRMDDKIDTNKLSERVKALTSAPSKKQLKKVVPVVQAKSKSDKHRNITKKKVTFNETPDEQVFETLLTNDINENADDNNADEMDIDDDGKRGITREMAKNKGLTPRRKKELRNPRVKHRNKFRKALIRRKGAVQNVRKELSRYGGEMTGIKRTVVKSVKIK